MENSFASLEELRLSISELDKRIKEIDRQLSDGRSNSSIVIKTIKGNPYYYEQWKEEGHLKNRCLGRVSPGVISDIERQIDTERSLEKKRRNLTFSMEQLEVQYKALVKYLHSSKPLDSYSFEIYWKNDISARVSVRGSKARINRLIHHPVHQLFASDTMSRDQVNKVLETRCFDRNRADADRVLESLGLSVYRPIDIVRKTHGVSYNDYLWIRFPGEDLRAEDVLLRPLV